MKKIIYILVLVGFTVLTAFAQTPSYGGGVGSGSAAAGSVVSGSAGSGIAYPVPVPPPINNGDIVQFSNLTIQSVSSLTPPAEIVAGYTVYPMMLNSGGAMAPASSGVSTPQAPQYTQFNCRKFSSLNDAQGTSIACPTPPLATTSAAAPNIAYPYPGGYAYIIEIDANTRLFLRDRTPVTLSSFSIGDQINALGYYNAQSNMLGHYNANSSIQAMVVRDISKPVEKTFYQLNNVQLVSVSATTAPATLIVVQQPSYPCYSYGASGTSKAQIYPCPLGVTSSQTPMMQNPQVPQSLMSTWIMSRKYVVNIDSQTIVVDRNRNPLSLAQLQVGDKLNIYGDMEGQNGPIDADIIRDLSQPITQTSVSGRVTQVNSDGSFVIQTDDGQTLTVFHPVIVGATVTLQGIINQAQSIISQITQLMIKNSYIYMPATAPPQSSQPSH